MAQITQHQINEGIRQGHIERSKAVIAGLTFIRTAVASGISAMVKHIAMPVRQAPHTQN